MRTALVACLAAALLTAACAGRVPAVIAPPANPALQAEGRLAAVGIRVVDAIRLAQAGVPTLVRTAVLTPSEGLQVLEGCRAMLETAGELGAALRAIDSARDLIEATRHWSTVRAKVSALLRSSFALGDGVGSAAGHTAVSGLLGGMGDSLADIVASSPAQGGGQ